MALFLKSRQASAPQGTARKSIHSPLSSNDQTAEEQKQYLSLLKQIRSIELKLKTLVNNVFAGEYRSRFKGSGMEFDEVQEYVSGDDIKTIDWNVTARMNRPFVKRYHEERELVFMLAVDISASVHFGSTEKSKHDVAVEIAAMLALSAFKSRDKIGLLLFTDEMEFYMPPARGRNHVLRIIRELICRHPRSMKSQLNAPLQTLAKLLKKRSAIFLISDFLYPIDYHKALQQLAHRHKLMAIKIYDAHERVFPKMGLVELEDAESGMLRVVDTSALAVRRAYQEQFEQHGAALKHLFKHLRVPFYSLLLKDDYLSELMLYFKSL